MKLFELIKFLLRHFPALLIGTTLFMVIQGAVESLAVIIIAPLLDILINPDLKNLTPLSSKVISTMEAVGLPISFGSIISVFLAFTVTKNAIGLFVSYLLSVQKYAVVRRLMVDAFDDFFRAKWYFFSSSKQGMLLNTITREVGVVAEAFVAIGSLFSATIQVAFLAIIPLYISWQVTLIGLGLTLLACAPYPLLGKVSYRVGQAATSAANIMMSTIQEGLGAAKLVLGFGCQDKLVKAVDAAYDSHRKATIKSMFLKNLILKSYASLAMAVAVAAVLAARAFSVPLAETAVLLVALLKTAAPVGDIVATRNAVSNFFPSYEQVTNLVAKARTLRQPSGAEIFNGFEGQVALQNVSFAYPGLPPVLHDINVVIPKGKMIAFVGESGAGKSTLIDLVMGFSEPLGGRITIDGRSFQDFDVNSFRKRIGYVPQESRLFNTTIRENLLWAKEGATNTDIERACTLANAHEFIESFSDGYDTLVGDRGVRLSGGQLQRVALARAMLRKPDLLILDEATSSLDTQSERLIQEAVEKISGETTVVVIAHRLSTIVNADYIYLLKEGRVAEEGTYSELMNLGGHFSRMVEFQALKATA